MKKVTLDEFFEEVGAISSVDSLKTKVKNEDLFQELILDIERDDPVCWEASNKSLGLLKRVCEENKDLHIVSSVFSDDNEKIIHENTVRVVNRDKYFLGTKNKGVKIFSEE